ncbi:MAG: TonB-dependent receptor plug domain-containing protein [Sphingobacteriaceae bacterium]|nr:TonB-dependent receptor plug domain-containing protein [Sphingobacteriaceae bacterium]
MRKRLTIIRCIVLTVLLFFQFSLFCQTDSKLLKGRVTEFSKAQHTGLPSAIVKSLHSKTSAISDIDGYFSIQIKEGFDTLVTYLTSFKNDTSLVFPSDTQVEIILNNAVNLKEVEVKYIGSGTEIAMLNTLKLETLGERSLMKAACCNLSESFETNPSVDVNFADAISGSKQIQMLGLAGQYAQITKENLPYMRGLSNSYGLTFIPGTWIESIQLGKGAGSVINGYESFTGQINTELKQPIEEEIVHFNAYANENARNEYNLNLASQIVPSFSTILLSHVSYNPLAEDKNQDKFMDIPTGRQYNFTNKYALNTSKGFEWQFGGSFLDDERVGGQVKAINDSTPKYKLGISNYKWDAYSKSGYVFRKPATSMGLQLNYTSHDVRSNYGFRKYDATQKTAYANLIFESYILNTNYKYKLGASYVNDFFDEQFSQLKFKREEKTAGVFGEFVYDYNKKFNVIVGNRMDYNNYYGLFFTPRVHARFAFSENSVARISAGRALRTANIFADNVNFMATSRNWIVEMKDSTLPFGLNPERAWNYGINFTQKFKLNYKEAYVTIDLYRTEFTSQVIIDADENPQALYIYNLDGYSFSNTAQIEFGWEIRKRLFVKTAYRYVDNQQKYKTEMRQKYLVARDRAFINFSYETKNEHWMFDATAQYNGSKRLPFTDQNPPEYQLASNSPEFYNVLGQITYLHKFNNSEFNAYLGVENALDFKQLQPIVASAAPYSKYFDAAMTWGPIYGRMLYIGIRFKIKKPE